MNTYSLKYKKLLLFICSFGLVGVFGVPYLPKGFYHIFKEALNLNHIQIGYLVSVYGTVGIISCLIGGFLLDKFSEKSLMVFGCFFNVVISITILIYSDFTVLVIAFACYAISCNMAFSPASLKMIKNLGENSEQATLFSLKEFFYGAIGTVFGLLILFVIGKFNVNVDKSYSFFVISYSFMSLIAGILILILYKNTDNKKLLNEKNRFKHTLDYILKKKEIWMIGLNIFSCYFIYSGLTYTSPYLSDVYKISDNVNLILGIVRQYIGIILCCLVFAKIANKTKSSIKTVGGSLLILAILSLSLVLMPSSIKFENIVICLIIIYTLIACGVRGVYFAQISEINFSLDFMGTIMGIIICVAFLPDAFYFSVMGSIIEYKKSMGNVANGYQIVFLISGIVGLIGSLISYSLYKKGDRKY